ncbi:MAG: CYCXC family (seleno)protein, partial [Terriglobales bacterium]
GLDLAGPSFKNPFQVRAYELAAKIPTIIYQQPCYCRCDRSVGHKSLHSCFESTHGAHCAACMRELFYTYEQHKAGKTAAQIREGIIKGEWEKLDLQAAAASD